MHVVYQPVWVASGPKPQCVWAAERAKELRFFRARSCVSHAQTNALSRFYARPKSQHGKSNLVSRTCRSFRKRYDALFPARARPNLPARRGAGSFSFHSAATRTADGSAPGGNRRTLSTRRQGAAGAGYECSASDAEGEEDASWCRAAKIDKLTRGATGCGLGLRRWFGNAQT